ncbi:MAG: group II intron reverse transcriptase/maturase, partial [Gammaproteobacteria bacterium]|nr:group II intron reverse transcriptase/maturase [Gammaproteobacteria bacterium]
GLHLHPDKTKLIEFGRFAVWNRKDRVLGKPENFDFLCITHYCAKTWKRGKILSRAQTRSQTGEAETH